MKVNARKTKIPITMDQLVAYGVLSILGLIVFIPAFWIVAQSLMPESQILKWPIRLFPHPVTFVHYRDLFIARPDRPELPIARWLFNSALVSTSVTVLVLIVASLAAFAFARMTFPGRDLLFMIFGASLLVPGQVTFIPTFLIVRAFGWIDTYHALIWPPIAGFFAVFFLRQFFMTIPHLDVSATCDPAARTVTLCVVNRHLERTLSTDLLLLGGTARGQGKIFEICAAPDARNSFAQPDAVQVQESPWPAQGSHLRYDFPPHSVTVLKMGYV